MIIAVIYLLAIIVSAIKRPMWSVALSANSLLINGIIPGEGGFVFWLVGLGAPLTCYFTVLISKYYKKEAFYTTFKIEDIFVVLLFIVLLFSSFYAMKATSSIEVAIRFLVLCASFYFITKIILSKDPIEHIEDYIQAIWFIGCIVAVYAIFKGVSASEYVMRLTIGDISPIPLSILLAQAMIINLYYLFKIKKMYLLVILSGTFILLLYVEFLTNTRSTLLASFAAMIYIIFLGKKALGLLGYSRIIIVCSALIPIIIGLYISNADMFERSFNGFARISSGDFGESEQDRIMAWNYAIYLFNDNVFLGIGTGNFTIHNITYPHNLFLEILAENGIVGFIVLFSLLALALKNIFKLYHGVGVLVASMFLFQLIVAQVSLTLWMHKSLFIWMACLFVIGSLHITKKKM